MVLQSAENQQKTQMGHEPACRVTPEAELYVEGPTALAARPVEHPAILEVVELHGTRVGADPHGSLGTRLR